MWLIFFYLTFVFTYNSIWGVNVDRSMVQFILIILINHVCQDLNLRLLTLISY
jgi:hypothetical protein